MPLSRDLGVSARGLGSLGLGAVGAGTAESVLAAELVEYWAPLAVLLPQCSAWTEML